MQLSGAGDSRRGPCRTRPGGCVFGAAGGDCKWAALGGCRSPPKGGRMRPVRGGSAGRHRPRAVGIPNLQSYGVTTTEPTKFGYIEGGWSAQW